MADTITQLDVRNIAPQKKHSTIFDTYNELNAGEAFIIINDHDPKPLRYQMMAVYGSEEFNWEYLEKGPGVWKVHISKSSD